MLTRDEFKKGRNPQQRKAGKLVPWKEDIAALRQDGYSLKQVQEFLRANQVEATVQEICIAHKGYRKKAVESVCRSDEQSPDPNQQTVTSQPVVGENIVSILNSDIDITQIPKRSREA